MDIAARIVANSIAAKMADLADKEQALAEDKSSTLKALVLSGEKARLAGEVDRHVARASAFIEAGRIALNFGEPS
jgi:hypothetical protein